MARCFQHGGQGPSVKMAAAAVRACSVHVPSALTLFRLAAGPGLLAWSLYQEPGPTFNAVFVLAGLSDAVDGAVARTLGSTSELGAVLDSRADTMLYVSMLLVALRWYPNELGVHALPIALSVASHLAQWAVALARFGRLASYHSITGKLWGVTLFVGFGGLFATRARRAGPCIWLMCAAGLANNAHEILISCTLPRWTPNVAHIGHALMLARQQRAERREPAPSAARLPPTFSEWAPRGLGAPARLGFLATNGAFAATSWTAHRLSAAGVAPPTALPVGMRTAAVAIAALTAISTLFHSVQTGSCDCCLRASGDVRAARSRWTRRLAVCDVLCACTVGGAAAHPLLFCAGPRTHLRRVAAAVGLVLFVSSVICRRRRRYAAYALLHGTWHIVAGWALHEALSCDMPRASADMMG